MEELNKSGSGDEWETVSDYSGSSSPSISPPAGEINPRKEPNLVEACSIKELVWGISCVKCLEPFGPPKNSCPSGHAICLNCLPPEGEEYKCATALGDETVVHECEEVDIFGIDDAIRNTPYYKAAMEAIDFSCKFEDLGCKVIKNGLDIERHHASCPFRLLEACQFEWEGCTETFESFDDYFGHLHDKHKVPMELSSHEALLVSYGQPQFTQDPTIKPEFLHVRAGFKSTDEAWTVVLIGQQLDTKKTRFFFLRTDSGVSRGSLMGSIAVYPGHYRFVSRDARWNSKRFAKDSLQHHLTVITSPDKLENLENTSEFKFFVDIDHPTIDMAFCVNVPPTSCHMAVCIYELLRPGVRPRGRPNLLIFSSPPPPPEIQLKNLVDQLDKLNLEVVPDDLPSGDKTIALVTLNARRDKLQKQIDELKHVMAASETK